MRPIVLSACITAFIGHAAYTALLAYRYDELRASIAADAERQREQQRVVVTQAIDEALDKFKTDLGAAMRPMVSQLSDVQALAAIAGGARVGCDGSRFEEGTLGAAAYRAYSDSGACSAQPAKSKRSE